MWILLALTAHSSWGLVNIGEKYLLGNRVKSPLVFFLWTEVVSLLALMMFFFVPFTPPPAQIWWWLLAVAALYTVGTIFYLKAVQIEEVTRINIWWSLIPFFTLVIAWITLSEKLSGKDLIAMGVLFLGAVLASLHSKTGRVKFSRAFLYMSLACLCFAGYAVIIRFVTKTVPFSAVFGLSVALRFLCSLPLFLSPTLRRDLTAETRRVTWPLVFVVLVLTLLDYGGIFLNQWALSLGPAALVFSLEGWQILFVFFVTAIISRFRPTALREDFSVRNLVLKFASAALMIVGILILSGVIL